MIERSKILEKDDTEYGKEYVLLSDARNYGDQRAAEAREQMLEAAKALCRELEANPENSHDYQCAAGWCAERIAGLK